ncbi:protein RETICULATA-RELATED 3, chloroplastic-like [Durio zibethinus]|uniref:Protein RETICULATA-RELATED 3, chloroplastic-like n=1 Tax=Durio zibethinus TaxID=66656 RepID=A0A6P6A918_DURZI|nr:protein RETICULATA-RELATED 3, chloroplastic-like [Durio zibethinus]XP_022761369.1 protein RETICULATA-RELATED 3, chloroplastic-like [Durio zibethinus]
MAAIDRYRFSMLTRQFPNMSDIRRLKSQSADVVSFPLNQPIRFQPFKISISNLNISCAGGGDGNNGVGRTGGGGGGGRGDDDSNYTDNSWQDFGVLGLFLSGWRDRVAADPQFPFKVLMEELVGVSACVLGDMASRPNFGLNELDFVFSTLIVGSILNFTLMYLLAPTASASSSSLPAIFANCPQSHMFEPGAYSFMNRFGTFVFKGAVFAAVGFAAGLVGTAISNGLIKMRKKMDPSFETPNKPPPTLLNAFTWAIHMGVSSNLRYQTLNGVEFLLAKGAPPLVFKSSVVVLRCLNNILGGMSFVILARMTGSQSVEEKPAKAEVGSVAEREKLVDGGDKLETNQSTFK